MTNKSDYLSSAQKTGLSAKASSVYVSLLDAGKGLAPKDIVVQSKLHRQYVYDGLEELKEKNLVLTEGKRRGIKYRAVTPDRLLEEAEKKRIDAMQGVSDLMKLYDRSPAGAVEVIRGKEAVIEYTFKQTREAKQGSYLDIIGGAGMTFTNLYKGRLKEYEDLRKEKGIKLRYIGGVQDVVYNTHTAVINNESRAIEGIDNIVNVLITPGAVTFNIYEPEIMTVVVKSEAAALSQRMLFETLWKTAKRYKQ